MHSEYKLPMSHFVDQIMSVICVPHFAVASVLVDVMVLHLQSLLSDSLENSLSSSNSSSSNGKNNSKNVYASFGMGLLTEIGIKLNRCISYSDNEDNQKRKKSLSESVRIALKKKLRKLENAWLQSLEGSSSCAARDERDSILDSLEGEFGHQQVTHKLTDKRNVRKRKQGSDAKSSPSHLIDNTLCVSSSSSSGRSPQSGKVMISAFTSLQIAMQIRAIALNTLLTGDESTHTDPCFAIASKANHHRKISMVTPPLNECCRTANDDNCTDQMSQSEAMFLLPSVADILKQCEMSPDLIT